MQFKTIHLLVLASSMTLAAPIPTPGFFSSLFKPILGLFEKGAKSVEGVATHSAPRVLSGAVPSGETAIVKAIPASAPKIDTVGKVVEEGKGVTGVDGVAVPKKNTFTASKVGKVIGEGALGAVGFAGAQAAISKLVPGVADASVLPSVLSSNTNGTDASGSNLTGNAATDVGNGSTGTAVATDPSQTTTTQAIDGTTNASNGSGTATAATDPNLGIPPQVTGTSPASATVL